LKGNDEQNQSKNESGNVGVKSFGDKVRFIWSVADLLRGPYKPPQYGRVILQATVLRRLDCVLEPTKEKVLAKGYTVDSPFLPVFQNTRI